MVAEKDANIGNYFTFQVIHSAEPKRQPKDEWKTNVLSCISGIQSKKGKDCLRCEYVCALLAGIIIYTCSAE